MIASPELDPTLLARAFGAVGRTFRGEIYETSAATVMGRGYSNAGKPFDIETACYTKPFFQSYRRARTGKWVIKAAVQTLKTYVMERTAAYEIQHDPGDMRFYLCDAEDAHDHAKGRLMDMLKDVPGIQEQLAEIASRHDVTTTEIYFPGMTFTVRPLNESSTQRVTLRYIKVSDAWLAKRNGFIRHAIARATQHPTDRKIIIESQGSDAGDDFDLEWESTNKQELHVHCPYCGSSQPFEWSRERPSDFVPAPPFEIPSLDHQSWIEGHIKQMAGKYSGMQRPPMQADLPMAGAINPQSAIRNPQSDREVLEGTFYECYHCGSHWRDTPQIRRQLDHTSHYIATNPSAIPDNIGFTWPAWINTRLPWGAIMLDYLNAKRADEQLGNRMLIKEWYQKKAAKQWRDDLAEARIRIDTDMGYDPKIKWVKEWRRIGIIDVQIHASHMWVSFDAIASDGESRQLFFGCLLSFDEIEKLQLSPDIRVQHNRMWIDYGHESELVKQQCFIRGKFYRAGGERRQTWHGWNMLTSSRYPDLWRKERDAKGVLTGRRYKDIVSDEEMYAAIVDGRRREVFRFNFSALACGDMFRRYRDGDGAPKSQFLAEAIGADKNELSHVAQIHARFRSVEIDKRTGRKTPIWKPKRHMIPDHAFAIGQMRMAVYRIWNIGSQVASSHTGSSDSPEDRDAPNAQQLAVLERSTA